MLQIQNESRVIVIRTQTLEERKKEDADQKKLLFLRKRIHADFMNIRADVQDFGLSLIAKFNHFTMELFYLYMNKVTAVAIITEKQREIQLAINYLNIDNNYYSLSKYPVFLTSFTPLDQVLKTGEQFLNFHCVQNVIASDNLLSFEVIEFLVQPLVVTTEDVLF